MSDIAFISPGSEGNHLVGGGLVMELYLDFGGFLFPVGFRRLHIWNWGSIHGVSPSHSEFLSPSGGFFVLALMIGMRSDLVSRKSFLKKLLGRDFLIQPNALPNIFAESKILTLFLMNLTPTWMFHDPTNGSCE
jgi:hypothetical protein